jgi:DNA-binding response OmpR family regulator
MSAAENTSSLSPRAAPTILVIEDDPGLLDVLSQFFTRAGYLPLLATSGVAGLALLEQEGADLIVLDLHLPDMDGWTITSRIHDRPTASPPILILTGSNREDGATTSLQLGADAYLTKPFVVDELLARVEVLLGGTRSTPE